MHGEKIKFHIPTQVSKFWAYILNLRYSFICAITVFQQQRSIC